MLARTALVVEGHDVFGRPQYLNALGFEEKQDFLLTFSSLALEGSRLAEVCYGTLRRIIDGEPVSDRYVLGLAWEINSIKTTQAGNSGA